MKGGREGKAGKGGKGGLHSWRIGFAHPLSAFQAFCILLSLNMDEEDDVPAPYLPSPVAGAGAHSSTITRA